MNKLPVSENLNLPSQVKVEKGVSASVAVRAAYLENNIENPQDDIVPIVVKTKLGDLKDLSWIPDEDQTVDLVIASSEEGLMVIRHSCAHVLAQAVQTLFPQAKLGIGPPIKDGFYYDFMIDHAFSPEDLLKLEKTMKQIIKSSQKFVRRVFANKEEARIELSNEPLKCELIEDKAAGDDPDVMEVGAGELTIYDNVNPRTQEVEWKDLCRGPHIPTTKYIPAFKLMRSSAAYWRGDQNNQGLQRIYGTAWQSQEALDQYLTQIEEAAKRDHRKLGNELDLFSFPDEIGSGLVVFHPKGGIIKYEMEDYSRKKHLENDYQFVSTPHITKGKLFEISGHLNWYSDGMFPPFAIDASYDEQGNVVKPGQNYYLKPMNCPMHNLIFRSQTRSYRDLPLRFFEFGSVYRMEPSGVVHGLTRARGFTQDDAHIYCTEDQMESELTSILNFVLNLLKDYGLSDYYLELSTKDPEKFIGDDEIWEKSTKVLEKVALDSGLKLVPDPGGAAFYGPKISVQAKDALGRTWQMSTIQLDFNLPKLFELEYTASDGSRKQPVMIHRALFGSIERFFGVLTEHYAGAFPIWLSPTQIVAVGVANEFNPYLQKIVASLKKLGIRAQVDESDDRMQKKIRNHTTDKTPIILIAGAKDIEDNAISFRFRDGSQLNGINLDEAIKLIQNWIIRKINETPNADNFQSLGK